MERKFVRFIGYLLAVVILVVLKDVILGGKVALASYSVLVFLLVFPLSRDGMRRAFKWLPGRNGTAILFALWLGSLVSLRGDGSSELNSADKSPQAQVSEKVIGNSYEKCKAFVRDFGNSRIGKQKGRRDDQVCEVFDTALMTADVYLEQQQVEVTFMGINNSVMFTNFHHPNESSALQSADFVEVWDKALAANEFTDAPKSSEIAVLYLRMGNVGKVTPDNIMFEANDCFGKYLVSASVWDNQPFAQRAGIERKIHESISIEACKR